MPISRERMKLYGPNWKTTSLRIRARAGGVCECPGDCGRDHLGQCGAPNGLPHPDTGSKVVLTVAHLVIPPGQPGHDADANLRAMCQACHLSFDREQHAKNAAETRRRKRQAVQPSLFPNGGT
jgi:hypothetical protein